MTAKTPRLVYTVKQINSTLRNLLEMQYSSIWVEGEVSGLATPTSGHLYFSLKDQNSCLRCVFFRNRQSLNRPSVKAGMQILLSGQISYYEARGDLQFIVNYMEEAGEGVLRRAFEMLKQKLAAEGLFAQQHKSEIPRYPTTIGIITSQSGAALHDILVTLKHRFPLQIILYPTLVQGVEAPDSLITAIESAEKHHQADILILARGGGSVEDLQAFNDERVARKMFDCTIPIVSGIGHEVDFTICDFVADYRAATPTAAAQYAAPEFHQIKQSFRLLDNRLHDNTLRYIRRFQQAVDYATSRLLHPQQKLDGYHTAHRYLYKQLNMSMQRHLILENNAHKKYTRLIAAHCPDTRIQYLQQRLHTIRRTLCRCVMTQCGHKQHVVQQNHDKIRLMNPEHTLQRGYAIVQNHQNKIITKPNQTKLGQSLQVRLGGGCIRVSVDDN